MQSTARAGRKARQGVDSVGSLNMIHGLAEHQWTQQRAMRWAGGELDAELSPLVPFKGVFQGAEPKRITHRFVLQRLMDPEWTYDRMSFGDQV